MILLQAAPGPGFEKSTHKVWPPCQSQVARAPCRQQVGSWLKGWGQWCPLLPSAHISPGTSSKQVGREGSPIGYEVICDPSTQMTLGSGSWGWLLSPFPSPLSEDPFRNPLVPFLSCRKGNRPTSKCCSCPSSGVRGQQSRHSAGRLDSWQKAGEAPASGSKLTWDTYGGTGSKVLGASLERPTGTERPSPLP